MRICPENDIRRCIKADWAYRMRCNQGVGCTWVYRVRYTHGKSTDNGHTVSWDFLMHLGRSYSICPAGCILELELPNRVHPVRVTRPGASYYSSYPVGYIIFELPNRILPIRSTQSPYPHVRTMNERTLMKIFCRFNFPDKPT